MRIEIPHSAQPITRVNVTTPAGPISADFTTDHKFFDVELPEGVTEDEVSVQIEYLNNGMKAVDGVTLKYAIEKPVEPPADEEGPTGPEGDVGPDGDCERGKDEACSTCDPEDEITEPKDEPSDE